MHSSENDIHEYLYELQRYIHAQTERILHLENDVHKLKNELNEVKKNRTINVEKIEYKFDQLKVETLEGTLNIGITPNSSESIEDFVVNQKDLNVSNNSTVTNETSIMETALEKIQKEIFDYFEAGIIKDFEEIETSNNYFIDSTYKQFIVEDLKKQMTQRINFYLNKVEEENLQNNSVPDIIIGQLKKDIFQAIESFIKNLSRKSD